MIINPREDILAILKNPDPTHFRFGLFNMKREVAIQFQRFVFDIEIDPTYFAAACKRIEAAYNQPGLFIAAPEPKAVLEVLL